VILESIGSTTTSIVVFLSAASKTPKNEKAADHFVGVALGLNHSAQSEI
jgi:hypothetical protein